MLASLLAEFCPSTPTRLLICDLESGNGPHCTLGSSLGLLSTTLASLTPYLSHAMCVSLSRPTAYPPVPSLWRDVSPHPSQALLLFREPLRLPNSPPALSLGPSWLLLPCSTLPLSRSLPPPPGQRPTPHPNLPGDPPARLRQPPAEAGGEHWAGAADAGTGSSLGL